MRTERAKALMLMLGIVFILSAIPIAQIVISVYGNWQGVPPPGVTVDQVYYLARINEIKDGYPFMGNPYVFEYRNAMAPAFFVPDWLSAIPLLLGLSLTVTAGFNMIFWALLLCLISYFIFEQLGLKPKESLLASVLTYLQVYWLVARPVSMQIVFPFFALFILAYILWLRSPLNKRNILFLAISSAAPFYIYAYLWQITCTVLFLTAIFLIFKKSWKALLALAISGATSIVLALPAIVYTIRQIFSPFYWETMARISLTFTRIPTREFLNYSRWVVLAIVLGLIILFLSFRKKEDMYCCDTFTPFVITGTALVVTAGSNIVFAKEMETAVHIGRFIIFWFSIFFLYFLVQFWRRRGDVGQLSLIKKIMIGTVISIALFGYLRNFYDQGVHFFTRIDKDVIVSAQAYAGPAEWLNKNVPSEQVIWTMSNSGIESYVPMLTRHYLLFSEWSTLQLMPSAEIEERYLIASYFKDLTLNDIERDFRIYSGTGASIHQYKTHNREVIVCKMLRLEKFGYSCGEMETDISFKGEGHFINLYDKYIKDIKPNIKEKLKKYGVSYILVDKEIDEFKIPITDLQGLEMVYRDNRFVIYKINY